MTSHLAPIAIEPDQLFPRSLFWDHVAKSDNLRVLPFEQDELLIEHRLVERIQFGETRCNVRLHNRTHKKRTVNVQIWVLNNALMELWGRSEKWVLNKLLPDQVQSLSWEFKPSVPDTVWNFKARDADPAWIVISSE